ncbi:MAG: PHB depolymerase family esterase [Dokdonella sp.]
MSRRCHSIVVALALAGASGAHAADASLPKLDLDATHTTVSGLSSGAYMAHQVHIAFSDHIVGAAMISGGPYHCAQDKLETALGSCMMPAEGKAPDVAALASFTKAQAKAGRIAPLTGLAGDHVLILHGQADKTVAQSLSADTASLYHALGASVSRPMIVHEDLERSFTHTFPTIDAGSSCETSTAPYVGKCGFDAAGEIFTQLYGKPSHAVGVATGDLRTFDQDRYRDKDADALMAAQGYLYVPKACAAGTRCALHVAFHGCSQSADVIGEAFVRDAGYNRWADAYNVVVLYPQARASMAPLNPKGCWDWWGYSGEGYDTREGAQMRWLANASAALGAPLR